MNEKEFYDRGMKVRRELLGAEYVDKAVAVAADSNQYWQEYVTKHCLGAIWTRPGLPRETRSMLNLAMLAAAGHPPELNLQVDAYAGAPSALEAFGAAQEVFTELKV